MTRDWSLFVYNLTNFGTIPSTHFFAGIDSPVVRHGPVDDLLEVSDVPGTAANNKIFNNGVATRGRVRNLQSTVVGDHMNVTSQCKQTGELPCPKLVVEAVVQAWMLVMLLVECLMIR